MVLFGAFAAAGASLAALGLAAVVAWWVSARRREIGVRMALGATVERVAMLVLGEGLALAVAGLTVGFGAAFLVTRLLKDWLYDVAAPNDLATFATCAGGMLLVTVLASYIPARRAARIDPLVALRQD
jgi:putative ABC transport system permease protein